MLSVDESSGPTSYAGCPFPHWWCRQFHLHLHWNCKVLLTSTTLHKELFKLALGSSKWLSNKGMPWMSLSSGLWGGTKAPQHWHHCSWPGLSWGEGFMGAPDQEQLLTSTSFLTKPHSHHLLALQHPIPGKLQRLHCWKSISVVPPHPAGCCWSDWNTFSISQLFCPSRGLQMNNDFQFPCNRGNVIVLLKL